MKFTISLMMFSAVAGITAQAALIHHYTFDGDLNDSVGTTNLSVNNSNTANYGSGLVGSGSYSLTNSSAGIAGNWLSSGGTSVVPTSTDTTSDNSYTVSWWAQQSAASAALTGERWMIGQGNDTADLANRILHAGFSSTLTAQNRFTHDYWTNGLQSAPNQTAASDATNWYFYAITYDAATDTRASYINGVEVASETVTNPLQDSLGDQSFYVGTRRAGQGSFTGLIDDVKVFDNAVTQTELATEFASNIPEPGVSLLSGLGALFLLRRKR